MDHLSTCLKSDKDMNKSAVLIFRLSKDKSPPIIREVLEERGWREFDETLDGEQEYHLWWKTQRFTKSEIGNCGHFNSVKQWLNHMPNSSAMTKKDNLIRKLRKMKYTYGQIFRFVPESFIVPSEYVKFVSAYSEIKNDDDQHSSSSVQRGTIWICKPADMSRGRKIFLFRDISELNYDGQYIVQKYIYNPLLIHGYKFDLRLYVLVTSFHPLKAYIYQNGLVRFSTEKYSSSELNNLYSHLTNASINKNGVHYDAKKEGIGHGSKWDFRQVKSYFESVEIDHDAIWKRIEIVLILTLISFVDDIPVKESNNCFELYGMDVMIDDNYQPWLLEVNYSPALTIDCATDEIVKRPLVEDLITLLQFKPDTQITPSLSYRKPDVPKQLSTNHMRTSVKSSSLLNPSADSQVFHKEVVGDFAQLFPFNDASRKASKSLDPSGPSSTKPGEAMKIIISQLKKVYNLC